MIVFLKSFWISMHILTSVSYLLYYSLYFLTYHTKKIFLFVKHDTLMMMMSDYQFLWSRGEVAAKFHTILNLHFHFLFLLFSLTCCSSIVQLTWTISICNETSQCLKFLILQIYFILWKSVVCLKYFIPTPKLFNNLHNLFLINN